MAGSLDFARDDSSLRRPESIRGCHILISAGAGRKESGERTGG
jgi:hypothetical protein